MDGNANEKRAKRCLYAANVLLYGVCVVYGLVYLISGKETTHAPVLIVLESLQAIALAFVPPVLEKVFRVRISFSAELILSVFSLGAIFFGQVFLFYDRVAWWDIAMHVMSGAMLFFYGTAIGGALFCKDGQIDKKTVVFGLLFALAAGLVWEIAEFSIDSIFGSDMQRFMPEIFDNGGNGFAPLEGTIEEIGEFYRNPAGYKFALADTMQDALCDLFGALVGVLSAVFLKQKTFGKIFRMLERKPKEGENLPEASGQ